VRTFLSATEQHEFTSAVRGRNFVLSVALPQSYHSSDKRYPVVYVLDGDGLFGMVGSLTEVATWTAEVPEVIAVCIGYGADSYDEWGQLRQRDLDLPTATPDGLPDDDRPQPDVFLAALADEIVPFVDRSYRTDPGDRCLYGYSSGGFFVLYALLQRSPVFHRYLSGGAFGYETMGYLLKEAERLKDSDHAQQPAHVFLGMSELEAPSCVAAMHEFVDILATAGHGGFHFHSEVYPSERHNAAGIVLTYLHGLRAVFAGFD